MENDFISFKINVNKFDAFLRRQNSCGEKIRWDLRKTGYMWKTRWQWDKQDGAYCKNHDYSGKKTRWCLGIRWQEENKMAVRKQDGGLKARWHWENKMAVRKQDGSEKARWWFKSKMAVRKQDGSEKTW